MHNSVGDVALTNICRETDYFHDLVQYPEKKFLAVLSLGMFLACS